MPARTPNPFRLALFWLGIQAVWGALLGISLQARTLELAGGSAIVAYGRLATLGAMVAAVVQVAAGLYSDRRRRSGSRRIEFYLAGAIGGAVAIAAFYGARSFTALCLAYLGVQLAMNVAIGPFQSIVPELLPRSRLGEGSSWMAALQSAGNALGALCASLLADARVLAGTLDALLIGTCAVTCAQVRGLAWRPQEPGAPVRLTRAFADLFISRALVYVGFYTLLGYLLFYVTLSLGVPSIARARLDTGGLILLFTLVGVLGAAIAARPSDRFDRRLVASLGGSLLMLALGLFIASHSLVGAAAATAVAGLGWGVFLVADWALVCRLLPPGALATTMGIWNLALILPQIAAPALTTAMLARLSLGAGAQGPRWAFGLALGEILLGIGWLWRLSRCIGGQ